MTAPGDLRDRVTFLRRATQDDGHGNTEQLDAAPIADLSRISARFYPDRFQKGEIFDAGRLQSETSGIVVIRNCAASRGILASDTMRIETGPIAGRAFQINAINPADDPQYINLQVQGGVAT